MGLFDKGVDPADFERFKKWVSQKFSQVEAKVLSTANESADAAAASARYAIESKDRIAALEPEITGAFEEVKKARDSMLQDVEVVSANRSEFVEEVKALKAKSSKALTLYEQMETAVGSANQTVEEIDHELGKVKAMLAEAEQIPSLLEALNKQIVDANAQSENIKSLLSHSLRRKGELDDIYKEVLGHDIEGEDGNVERVDGLRDQLEKSFDVLSDRATSLSEEVDKAVEGVSVEYAQARASQTLEFQRLLDSSASQAKEVEAQLKALLPGALAAGLSAAYETKKEEEAISSVVHERNFKYAIYGLIAVSLIPFSVDTYLLVNGVPLVAVLKDTPRLIISILPIYLPVLWLAYSANKRLNLSKRLIEEYTHKAVLGKTFSGLSNQIESLPHESAVKEELRTRLLFNVLQVSAENPGKLITDYNKSDHPLMDVLEKSARLSESVDALSKIPGFSGIAKKLAERRDLLLREQESRVREGLSVADVVEKRDLSESGSVSESRG